MYFQLRDYSVWKDASLLCRRFLQSFVSLVWLSLNAIYSQSHCYIACVLLPSKLCVHYHWYFCTTHHDLSSSRLSWDFASMYNSSCVKDLSFSIYGPCSAFWGWLFLLHSWESKTHTCTKLFFCNRQAIEERHILLWGYRALHCSHHVAPFRINQRGKCIIRSVVYIRGNEDIDDGKPSRNCSVSRCVLSSSDLHFLVGIDLVAGLASGKNKAENCL